MGLHMAAAGAAADAAGTPPPAIPTLGARALLLLLYLLLQGGDWWRHYGGTSPGDISAHAVTGEGLGGGVTNDIPVTLGHGCDGDVIAHWALLYLVDAGAAATPAAGGAAGVGGVQLRGPVVLFGACSMHGRKQGG
jgi:hypothetical protein